MKRKRKRPIPILLLWSKGEQRRFSEAVEAIVGVRHELVALVEDLRARTTTAARKAGRKNSAQDNLAFGNTSPVTEKTVGADSRPSPSAEGGAT